MKVIALAPVLALAFLTAACEKQSYSETRAFTHHGSHGGHAGGASHGGTAHGGTAHTNEAAAGAAGEKPAASTPSAH